jgi:hypothetical protein
MRWLVALALLVAIAPAGAQPASVTVRFKGPKVGETFKEEMFRAMTLSFIVNGQPSPVANEWHEHKTTEVLAVSGRAATKARITWTKFSDVTKRAGGAGNKGGPSLDKPYTLTSGLPTKVESKDGPVPELEADLVRERERRFGTDDRFSKAVDGKTFAVGKVVNVSAPDLFDDPLTKVKTLTMTYREMVGSNAAFDMTLVMVGDGGLKFVADLTGRVVLDPKTANLQELTLHGTVEYKQSGATGTGSMTLRFLRK